MTIQSKDTFKVQLGESVSFFFFEGGLLTEIWMRGCVQDHGRLMHLQKPTPAWVTALESWKPGVHHTACRQLDMGESLSSSFLSWSVQLV